MKVWSEKNGRADIVVYGFTVIDNLFAFAAGLIMLAGCIASIMWLS